MPFKKKKNSVEHLYTSKRFNANDDNFYFNNSVDVLHKVKTTQIELTPAKSLSSTSKICSLLSQRSSFHFSVTVIKLAINFFKHLMIQA